MAIAAALGSVAVGTSGIWSYNRENFLYDREMRQHQEFTVLEMKLRQADLWREDVRDLIGLTEKKMDSYMVVNALQLGFCVTIFADGRLEPGTPEWLLWLHTMTLVGAFAFLLMSVWFAMHASVVAQGSSVRLLTQLVRPVVPSWQQVESMRTYANAYEGVPATQMLRIPILQTIKEGTAAGTGGHSGASDCAPGVAASDPWGLERRGADIYELQRRPLPANRHVHLVRECMRHSQAYDAFARVAMTLGTILLCQALTYYMLGYVLIQDGSPWAAWASMGVFMAIGSMILRLDVSMTFVDHSSAQVCLLTGPIISSFVGAEWATYIPSAQMGSLPILCAAFFAHPAFLLLFLRLCRVELQPGGVLLPISFRSVLYLDVFGWLSQRRRGGSSSKMPSKRQPSSGHQGPQDSTPSKKHADIAFANQHRKPRRQQRTSWHGQQKHESDEQREQYEREKKRLGVVHGQTFPRHFHKDPVALRPDDVDNVCLNVDDPDGHNQAEEEASEALFDDLHEFDTKNPGLPLPGVGPEGVIPVASSYTFMPDAFAPMGASIKNLKQFLRSGRDMYPPGQAPWYFFRNAVAFFALLWSLGCGWLSCQILRLPDIPDRVLPESISIAGKDFKDTVMVEGAIPTSQKTESAQIASLHGMGERVLTEWPHERFQPWGLSCDSTGRHFVISDEFQLYFASMADGGGKYFSNNGETPGENFPVNVSGAASLSQASGFDSEHFGARALRPDDSSDQSALGSGKDSMASDLGMDMPTVRLGPLHTSPRCSALEGQTMRDVGLVCENRTASNDPLSTCRVLILHEHGTRLAECEVDGISQEGEVWQISSSWLRFKNGEEPAEEVVSIAIDTSCPRSDGTMMPEGWCSIVATSQGRMVRLRPHFQDDWSLVPGGTLWNALGDGESHLSDPQQMLTTSSLHMAPGGYLLFLGTERRSIQAIDVKSGRRLGQWQLPGIDGRAWSALAAGGGYIFIASQSVNGDVAKLWRFPIPEELRSLPRNMI